jgi:serine/arginine repetitive matrix protein 2
VDDEDEMPINHSIGSRMSTLNPVMGMGLPMPMQMARNSVAWGGNMVQPMHPSAYLMPPPADPKFLAAHQHAMMYAKQAYQMAVAQQAMAAAGDEWERGSSVGGYAGSGIIGASPSPAMMGPHFGMMPMGQGYGWPSPSSVYLPSSSQSMYGGDGSIGNSRSEYGGIKGPNNWPSSRSSYGESFGPSLNPNGRKNAQTQRNPVYSSRVPVIPAAQSQNGRGSPVPRSGNGQPDSAYLPSMSPMPASQFQSGRGSPDNTPRSRTASQPASPSRSTYGRKAPPSSWKPGV